MKPIAEIIASILVLSLCSTADAQSNVARARPHGEATSPQGIIRRPHGKGSSPQGIIPRPHGKGSSPQGIIPRPHGKGGSLQSLGARLAASDRIAPDDTLSLHLRAPRGHYGIVFLGAPIAPVQLGIGELRVDPTAIMVLDAGVQSQEVRVVQT